jgi:hypothetical protein
MLMDSTPPKKKIYQANGPPKQAGVGILKVDFKLTLVKRGKEGHSIII